MLNLEKVTNIIFPPKCGICGKINDKYLCKKCEKKLENEAIWQIEENKNPYIYYKETISIFSYKNLIREKILSYKFNEKSYLYKTFANFLLKNQKVFEKIQDYDIIIPVPISKKRKMERGYNQSLLIAREICRQINEKYRSEIINKWQTVTQKEKHNKTKIKKANYKIQLVTKCLYKTKNTIEQSKLNKEEREKNSQNVYELQNKNIIENKKVLLFDDIFTTGNTVNSCCRELKKSNPKKIGVLVLAKD